MSTTSSPSSRPVSAQPWYSPSVWLKPHLTVYHLTVAAILGLATAGFTALIGVLLIIALNFNVLGWME